MLGVLETPAWNQQQEIRCFPNEYLTDVHCAVLRFTFPLPIHAFTLVAIVRSVNFNIIRALTVAFYSVRHTVNGHSADGTRAGQAILGLDFHISLIKTLIFITRLTWLYVKSALWNLLPFVLSARLWRAIQFLIIRFLSMPTEITTTLKTCGL